MKYSRRQAFVLAAAAGLAMRAKAEDRATVHDVEMLNKDPETGERQVFNPPVVQVAVGDVMRFIPTDKGHNAEANPDISPRSADRWRGKINQELEVRFDVPGVHGFHCTPHRSVGMVGLVLVGDVTQPMLDAASDVRPRGQERARYDEYLALAAEMISAR